MMVDEKGEQKGIVGRSEHKGIAADRIVLVRGPEDEVATIQESYRQFVEGRRSEREIADWLNEQGILSDLGRSWTRGAVHQILINDKYAGPNVWGRTSFKQIGRASCRERVCQYV